MKHWYIALGALALASAAGLVLYRKRRPQDPPPDGGVRHRVDTNAPKVIVSTQITYFHCHFSTTDRCREDSSIAGQIITLHADEAAGYCRLRYRPEEENRSFIPDAAFFRQLQQLVSRFDLAQYNGQYYTVSGLPPDCGMELQIRYASGETISASNNQSCFLPLEAMEALTALFERS